MLQDFLSGWELLQYSKLIASVYAYIVQNEHFMY